MIGRPLLSSSIGVSLARRRVIKFNCGEFALSVEKRAENFPASSEWIELKLPLSLSLSKAFYGLAVKRGKIIKILGKGVSRPRSGLRKPGLVATSEVKEIRDQPL